MAKQFNKETKKIINFLFIQNIFCYFKTIIVVNVRELVTIVNNSIVLNKLWSTMKQQKKTVSHFFFNVLYCLYKKIVSL